MKKLILRLLLFLVICSSMLACNKVDNESLLIYGRPFEYTLNMRGIIINPNYISDGSEIDLIVYDNYYDNLKYWPENTKNDSKTYYLSFKNSGYVRKIMFVGNDGKKYDYHRWGKQKVIDEDAFDGCDSIISISFNHFMHWSSSVSRSNNYTERLYDNNAPYSTFLALNKLENLQEINIVAPATYTTADGMYIQSIRDNFLCLDYYKKNMDTQTYEFAHSWLVAYPMGLGNNITITSNVSMQLLTDIFKDGKYEDIYIKIPANVVIDDPDKVQNGNKQEGSFYIGGRNHTTVHIERY